MISIVVIVRSRCNKGSTSPEAPEASRNLDHASECLVLYLEFILITLVWPQDDLDRLLETKQLGFKKMDESELQKLKKAAAEYYNKHRRLNQCRTGDRIMAERS